MNAKKKSRCCDSKWDKNQRSVFSSCSGVSTTIVKGSCRVNGNADYVIDTPATNATNPRNPTTTQNTNATRMI